MGRLKHFSVVYSLFCCKGEEILLLSASWIAKLLKNLCKNLISAACIHNLIFLSLQTLLTWYNNSFVFLLSSIFTTTDWLAASLHKPFQFLSLPHSFTPNCEQYSEKLEHLQLEWATARGEGLSSPILSYRTKTGFSNLTIRNVHIFQTYRMPWHEGYNSMSSTGMWRYVLTVSSNPFLPSSERWLPSDAQRCGGSSRWTCCHGVYSSKRPSWAHHLMEEKQHPGQRPRRKDYCKLTCFSQVTRKAAKWMICGKK